MDVGLPHKATSEATGFHASLSSVAADHPATTQTIHSLDDTSGADP
jgi:hypothetical protein